MMADLATATVAALAPRDFEFELCEEQIEPVNFDHPADWIAITGKVSQRGRMIAIADEFRRRGKRVIIGGPYASLSPARLRDHCDVLVSGETEEIAAELFSDLRAGKPKDSYVGDKPSLASSPLPRWDLYRNDRAILGAVQTSRGCPFECEFCDVIQYLGRKQRHKPIANVIAELDALWTAGYRTAFLADDNFTAYRAHCKELLAAIAHWRRDRPMEFVTQISIDATRDEELLDMCVAAGLTQVFVGIETPNVESLRETGKRQNLKISLVDEIQKLVDHGMSVMGGMIVGFDHDGPSVFAQQYDFAMATPIPIFSLGALMASEATPLFDRITREGRLITGGVETQAVPWSSNIQCQTMSMEELHDGMQNLCNALYAPAAFGERMLNMIKTFGRNRKAPRAATLRPEIAARSGAAGDAGRHGRAQDGRSGRPDVEQGLGRRRAQAGDHHHRRAHHVPICAGAAHVRQGQLLGAAALKPADRTATRGVILVSPESPHVIPDARPARDRESRAN